MDFPRTSNYLSDKMKLTEEIPLNHTFVLPGNVIISKVEEAKN